MSAVVVVAAVLAGAGILDDDPEPAERSVGHLAGSARVEVRPGWQLVPMADAGLEPGARLWALGSDGDRAVLAGGVPEDDWSPLAWWSDDGVNWNPAVLPADRATPFAVAIHGEVALMSGNLGPEHSPFDPFLWRSDDGGRSWTELQAPSRRPLADLRWLDGGWVGLDLHDHGSIWVSEDGQHWDRVEQGTERCARSIPSRCVPMHLADLPGDRMAGFGHDDLRWTTDDAARWGRPTHVRLEESLWALGLVADGAELGIIGNSWTAEPERLVRSTDQGRIWEVDQSFPGVPHSVFQSDDLQLVGGAGWEGRASAWVATDDGWSAMPDELRGPSTRGPVDEVDGRIVLFGDESRFVVYQPGPGDG